MSALSCIICSPFDYCFFIFINLLLLFIFSFPPGFSSRKQTQSIHLSSWVMASVGTDAHLSQVPPQGQHLQIPMSPLHPRKRGEKCACPWSGAEIGPRLTARQRRKVLFAAFTICEPSTLGEPSHNSQVLLKCTSKRLKGIKLWLSICAQAQALSCRLLLSPALP